MVISKSPSSPQSAGGDSGTFPRSTQLQCFPECVVLTCTRQVRSRQPEFQGRAGSAQLTALLQRQEKCQFVPAHCSCRTGKNTVSAGSEIAGGPVRERPYHHSGVSCFEPGACFVFCRLWVGMWQKLWEDIPWFFRSALKSIVLEL